MPSRRFVIAAVIAAVLVFLVAAGLVHQRSTDSWEAMQATVAELEAARDRRESWREPLWGESVREPAAPHYDEALQLQAELPAKIRDAFPGNVLRGGEGATFGSEEERARWQPIVAALRRGARAVDTKFVVTVGLDPNVGTPDLFACRRLVRAAVFEARWLAREGRALAAVRTMLDGATFANDLATQGVLIQQLMGRSLVAIAIDTWPPAMLAGLGSVALDELATGLSRLDERQPVRLSFDDDLIVLARYFAAPWDDVEPGSSMQAWRFGFSNRWMMADAFHHIRRLWQRLERPSPTWPAREATLEHEFAGLAQIANPIVQVTCPSLAGGERTLRETLTMLRMLRLAVDLHRGQEPALLDDPLGTKPLVVEKNANGYRIRSVGERAGKSIQREVRLLVLPKAASK